MIVPLGERAIRFPRPAGASPRALVRAIRSWPGVIDVVVASDSVAAYFDGPPNIDLDQVRALESAREDASPVREHVLRLRYDGPDLAAIAEATGLETAQVISRHTAARYVVDTLGFAPGFAYLRGLDPRLELPRRATPRERVPAGTVAIAADQTAIYPFDSPGGWHLLGTVCDVRMFDERGALLQIGDHVRFTEMTP